uniref:Solute carrier family 66 member 3 n=1 Tax=Naja naja TaxID=35670 RepID=A0A8C6XSD8_NAJNA
QPSLPFSLLPLPSFPSHLFNPRSALPRSTAVGGAASSAGWSCGRALPGRKGAGCDGSGSLLLEAANWSTIAVCLVLKLPQGAALVAARSARGVSLESLLLELGGFLVCLRYMSYYRYPQLTYIEYPVMIVQDIILCLLVLHFNGKMKHALPYTVIFVAGWYAITLQEWILDLSMNLSTVVSAASKLAQLRCLWQTRDSEQVSATTWGLAIYTCADTG